MGTELHADAVAAELFGWQGLRQGQEAAIANVMAGVDTLAIMPTGHGKSAIYQIAGAMLPGPVIVVSPLIALQIDQIEGLAQHRNAPRGVAINSSQGARKNGEAWSEIEDGRAKFLFLSPEQLANTAVIDRLRPLGVSLVVIDEAHCVSSWGHDFRPDYLLLGDAVDALSHPVALALTATGSPPVRDEIVERLHLRDAHILSSGFDRPNLKFGVIRHEDDVQKRAAVVAQVRSEPKPGLVYVSTRRDTERFAEELDESGTTAAGYHGGLSTKERQEAYDDFHDDLTDVVVATSAFGMGIDKPDVRFVIHAAITDSLESYYQEVGRAGRDDQPAQVTLHYRPEDLALRNFFATHPDKQQTHIDQSRLAMMRSYAETKRCRRQFLLGYFGEDLPRPCGYCDNCDNGNAYEVDDRESDDDPFRPESVVLHRAWGQGTIMTAQNDRMTIFFPTQGYKTVGREAIARGILTIVAGGHQ